MDEILPEWKRNEDSSSEWREVTSGVPKGSVLAPIVSKIYIYIHIYDMTEGINSYIPLFTDDAKLSCVTNLLSFYSRVTDIKQEREGWADRIYLDLKKSF